MPRGCGSEHTGPGDGVLHAGLGGPDHEGAEGEDGGEGGGGEEELYQLLRDEVPDDPPADLPLQDVRVDVLPRVPLLAPRRAGRAEKRESAQRSRGRRRLFAGQRREHTAQPGEAAV